CRYNVNDVQRWWGGWVVSTSTFLSIRNGDPACNTALNVHSSEGGGLPCWIETKAANNGRPNGLLCAVASERRRAKWKAKSESIGCGSAWKVTGKTRTACSN